MKHLHWKQKQVEQMMTDQSADIDHAFMRLTTGGSGQRSYAHLSRIRKKMGKIICKRAFQQAKQPKLPFLSDFRRIEQ